MNAQFHSLSHKPLPVAVSESEIKVRYNEQMQTWQVWTFFTGIKNTWRWFTCTKETAEYYKDSHNATTIPYVADDDSNFGELTC